MPAPGKTSKSGHFARYNALVENGWLQVLTQNQHAMWTALEKFADRDGIAYPDGKELARLIGHADNNNVGRIRRQLVNLGLIEVVNPGGKGPRDRCKIRVLIPRQAPDRKAPQTKALKDPQSGGAKPESSPSLLRVLSPSNRTEKDPQIDTSVYREEQPIEQPIKQPSERGGESTSAERFADQVEDWMRTTIAGHLRGPEFFAAFGEWIVHLRERNGREPGVLSLRRQIEKCNGMSRERATRMIEHSIAGNWTSLNEPKAAAESDDHDSLKAEIDRMFQ